MNTALSSRLEGSLAPLVAYLRRHAAGLLRFEAADDLAQGVLSRAIAGSAGYEHRGDEAFQAWLYAIARNYVAERQAHWNCMKRGAGRVLRYTTSVGSEAGQVGTPAASGPGPRTLAETREQLVLAIKAIATLPRRDQDLVRWASEGISLQEQAERLELTYEAVQRAGLRAMDRFRRAFRVLTASDA